MRRRGPKGHWALLLLGGIAFASGLLLQGYAHGAVGESARHVYAGRGGAPRAVLRGGPLPTVPSLRTPARTIALTFDDGPGPYTPQVLSILERHGVPATFFEVGVLERYFYGSTSAIVADGDAIGDHTEGHAAMSRLSRAGQSRQLLADAAAIERRGARFPRLFRPPYGMWNRTTLGLLHRYRMLMVLWTVDTGDYRRPGVKAIVRAALAGARPGAIILLHDAGGNRAQTVKALPRIIAGLRHRGYRLVTVPRLLLDNPAPRVQNIAAVIGTGG